MLVFDLHDIANAGRKMFAAVITNMVITNVAIER